jgi:hypothetical protein
MKKPSPKGGKLVRVLAATLLATLLVFEAAAWKRAPIREAPGGGEPCPVVYEIKVVDSDGDPVVGALVTLNAAYYDSQGYVAGAYSANPQKTAAGRVTYYDYSPPIPPAVSLRYGCTVTAQGYKNFQGLDGSSTLTLSGRSYIISITITASP